MTTDTTTASLDETTQAWQLIEGLEEPGEGEMAEAVVAGIEVALYRVGGVLYATENVCTHAYAMLTDGWLDGHTIECPLHGGQFDIRSGTALKAPAECALRTFRIRTTLHGTEILLPLGAQGDG